MKGRETLTSPPDYARKLLDIAHDEYIDRARIM